MPILRQSMEFVAGRWPGRGADAFRATPASGGFADGFERVSSDLALDAVCGAYNEEAFRYFLEIERGRAELSGRPLLLLLIDLKNDGARETRMPAVTADKLFAALSLCLRDTDFVGWYRDGRVAGAVLTQHAEVSDSGLPELVAQRVSAALKINLSPEISLRVQVRVYHLPATAAS